MDISHVNTHWWFELWQLLYPHKIAWENRCGMHNYTFLHEMFNEDLLSNTFNLLILYAVWLVWALLVLVICSGKMNCEWSTEVYIPELNYFKFVHLFTTPVHFKAHSQSLAQPGILSLVNE